MKAILSMLALLALAGAASANYAPWYYQTLYKWRCYVPGCNECDAYNPYVCTSCAAGYALLKDNTCGCAPGFGSYVQPPMSGYPWYPPQSCPTWVKSKTGTITKGVVRATGANGRATNAVSLKTWYSTKPSYCTQTYYAHKTCQGSIPVSSVGYCKCFACPAGTTSPGGAINSMAAGCTPGAQPVQRCKGYPPAIPNAKPWNPTKCLNLKPGKACRTTCATGFVAEPAGANLTAACTQGGVWKTSGACAAVSAVCKGSPKAGANAEPFTNCTDGADGAQCSSSCLPGFDGEVTAVCEAAAGDWVVTNTCTASGASCAGAPTATDATFMDDCVDSPAGTECVGTCSDGVTTVLATCGADGQWAVDSTCPSGGVACAGKPDLAPNAGEWTNDQTGGACADGALGDACQAPCTPPFVGGGSTVAVICEADPATGEPAWSLKGECTEGGGGGGDITCAGLPADASADNANPWPESCAGQAFDYICLGTCANGFNATGSLAESYCTETGEWLNNVDCFAKKKKRGAGH